MKQFARTGWKEVGGGGRRQGCGFFLLFSRRQKEKPTSRSTNSKNRKTKWVLLWKIDGRWMEGRIKKVEKDSNRGIEREREEKKRKKKATSTFLVDLL